MKKMYIMFSTIFGIICCLFLIQSGYAAFLQEDSKGTFTLNFQKNQEGISAVDHIKVNTKAGTLSMSGDTLTGFVVSAPITPSSFSRRTAIDIAATLPTQTHITTTLLDCADTPISGYIGISDLSINIASISATTFPCLKVRVDMSRDIATTPSPTLSSITATRQPLPVYQIILQSPQTVQSDSTLQLAIQYALNYVDDTNVIAYLPLPTTTNGMITGNTHGQGTSPSFVSATMNGIYTATTTTIHGVAIPANSVYLISSIAL